MASGNKSDRPNILIILNDDMGYSDIGCYGGEIETPNLDRLAANGLRYSQFYNTARCSPSRASLLTGLHPHQTGIGILTYSTGPEGYAGNLNKSCVTIAEVLRQQNYTTYLSGKWHVAQNLTEPTDAWPLQRGFDHFYGTIIGAGSFYHPTTLTRGNENIEHEYQNDPSFFYTDAINDRAAANIRQHKEAVLPVCRAYRAALATACARRGHREIQRPLRCRLGQAARAAFAASRR
jgi:arylsulfatase A-like enzyme